MYYILYVSQANRIMNTEEISELLETSRKNNIGKGITGLLIYKQWPDDKSSNFLQILEGPRDGVERVYEKITSDNRHHTIIVLERGEITERNFGTWSMGFKNLETSELKMFPGFKDIDENSFNPENFSRQIQPALETMKMFYGD
jgi:hypothetical protein